MATVTLRFTAAAGNYPLATLASKMRAASLFRGELDMLGMVVSSDSTGTDGSDVIRTIVLETTDEGDDLWPTEAELEYATKNLYRSSLEMLIPAAVVADDPVAVL